MTSSNSKIICVPNIYGDFVVPLVNRYSDGYKLQKMNELQIDLNFTSVQKTKK